MDENKNFNENNEVVANNNDAVTVKLDLNSVEATETGLDASVGFSESAPVADEYVATQPLEAPMQESVNAEPVAEPVQQAMPQYPEIAEQPVIQQPVMQQPVMGQPQFVQPQQVMQQPVQPKQKKAKKAKKTAADKAKSKKNLGIFLRIFVITILSVATLWTVMYTIDHTLAAQGITPVFALKETEYEGGNISCECIGYKVQFVFDENGQLKQSVNWTWEKGPNDILAERGVLFEKI